MSWGSPGECPQCPGAVPCRGDLSLQPQPRCGAASRASALGTQGRIHPAKFRFPPGQWLYRGQTDYREQGETRSLRAPTPGCPWGQRGLGWPGGCGMARGCQGKFTSPAQASAPCLGHVQLGPGSLRPSWHPTAVGSRGRMWFLPPPAPVTGAQSITGTGTGTLAPHLTPGRIFPGRSFPSLAASVSPAGIRSQLIHEFGEVSRISSGGFSGRSSPPTQTPGEFCH